MWSQMTLRAKRSLADDCGEAFENNPTPSQAKRFSANAIDAFADGAVTRPEFIAYMDRVANCLPGGPKLSSPDPDEFKLAMIGNGYEDAGDVGACFRKRMGHHAVQVVAGGGGAPTGKNWAVELYLNGQRFNRWSSANFPDVLAALLYAVAHVEAIDGVQASRRPPDPLASLEPAIRARLVDEMGFSAEVIGGGATALTSYASGGGHVMVTCYGGGDLPESDDWQACAYDTNEPGEPILDLAHERGQEDQPLSMFEAVAACLSIVAEREGH